MSGLGPSFIKIWTCGSSPRSGSRNAWTRIKNVNGASHLSSFWKFFGANQMISCRDWWPWTKPGYITTNRRQSNNHWSGGIAAHPHQKIPSPKIHWKSYRLDFFRIKTASSLVIIFQRAKLSTPSITNLCWCNWRTFEGKTSREVHQECLVLARKCPGSPGTCNPEETGLPGLPISWSSTLFSGTGPVGLPPVPWLKKKQLKGLHFSSDAEVIAAPRPGWTDWLLNFYQWLSKGRATC